MRAVDLHVQYHHYIIYSTNIHCTYTRKLLPISPPALTGEISIHEFFFSCINNFMATFTILVKYGMKYFCNTKVAELGKFFLPRNFGYTVCIVYM